MDATQILEEINRCLQEAMQSGLGNKGLVFPFDLHDIDDKNLRAICDRLSGLFDMINESYQYSEELAQGDLKATTSRTNIFAMPLKALQANLSHLAWQANQVAKGDLSQQVHFLGDFSDSFNHMINSLREKKILEQQFKLITDAVGEGIFLCDAKGKIVFSNPEANRMLGYDSSEIEGACVHELIYKQQLNGILYQPGGNPLYNAILLGEIFNTSEGAFTCKSGFLMAVMITCRPVFKGDALDGAVIAFRDFTEQKKYLESLETINTLLEKQATTDALTGIYNRMKFNKSLSVEMAKAERYSFPLSLVIFDIDFFKKVNDTHGHVAGDNVLKLLAKFVTANIRETDVFARWGGEEFVVLAPGLSLVEAKEFAEKLRRKVEEFDFQNPKNITLSFGVTSFKNGDTGTLFLNRADEALYRAKENGRNQVQWSE